MNLLTPLLLVALVCAASPAAHGQGTIPPVQPTNGAIAPEPTLDVTQPPVTDEATLDSLVRTELSPQRSATYVVHPELRALRTSTMEFSGAQSAIIPQPITEALNLLAEIAVSRAKRQGLQVLQAQFKDSVCGLSVPAPTGSQSTAKGPPLLPATCTVLTHTSLEQLVSDPEPVTVAVAQDLLADAALALTRQPAMTGPALSQGEAEAILRVSFQLMARATSRGKPHFTVEDSWALASSIINSPLLNRKDALGAGLHAVRIRLEHGQSGGMAADLSLLVKKILAEWNLTSAEDYALALDIALEAQAALLASQSKSTDTVVPLPQERLRSGIRLTLKLVSRLVEADAAAQGKPCAAEPSCVIALRHLELSGELMMAAIDGSQPRMIIAGAEILQNLLGPTENPSPELRKVSILLGSIAGYAATFSHVESSDLQAVRESRKEILEGMIDASTDRSQRQGEVIWSIGAPVGFTSRLLQGRDWRAPQLTLPMGIAVQLMPGSKSSPPNHWGVGAHFMLTAIDLGQLLAYQPDANLPGPTWDAVVTPGAQLAATFGTPHNAFLVGVDLRYARNPLAVSAPDAVIPREPLVNLFVAYYVPFFDFN